MNTPIINPTLIYLVNLADRCSSILTTATTVMSVLLAGIIVASGIIYFVDDGLIIDREKIKKRELFKYLKIVIISIVSCAILGIVIPDKQTVYTMFATSQLTPQNIETVGNGVKGVIDYVFEKIDELEE